MSRSLLFVLALLAPACASAPAPTPPEPWQSPLSQNHPLVGRIFDVAAGAFIDEAELARRAVGAHFLLLGEKHDNPDHHRLQALAVRWLVEAGRKPQVVLEMIEQSRQPDVDAQLERAPKDPDALALLLDWAHSGWPDWAMYRPIFATTMDAELPIIAAMLPRDRAMSIARGTESLPSELVERHGLAAPLPDDLQLALIEELRDGHCGHLPDAMLEPMLVIQRARDATMAEKLLGAGKEGAVLIAGGGHTRTDRAVPWYLRRLEAPKSLSLGFVEVEEGELDPTAYASKFGAVALPFDLVWFTPRANDIDHCAEMEKMMKRHKGSP